jgi:hypothetical protein
MIDRILSNFGYVKASPRVFDRVNNGDDAVSRGQRWQLFYSEIGGLHDMINDLRRGYFEKVSGLKPGDTDALQALSMAYRIAGEIEGQVRTVIETGKLREAEADHVNRIAATTR